MRLLVQSEHFLLHLGNGGYPDAPADLEQRLQGTAVISLRQQLEDGGLGSAADPAERMVLQQRLLLRTHRVEGRAEAAGTAEGLDAAGTLRQLRNQAETWPCFASSRAFNGFSEGQGSGGGIQHMSEKVYSAIFALFGLLVVGGGSYFWWRSKIDQRRNRRFSCWIPCTVSGKTGINAAALADISCSGAKLRSDVRHTLDDTVTLKVADTEIPARIVRVSRRYCAVHFLTQLSSGLVQQTLDRYS